MDNQYEIIVRDGDQIVERYDVAANNGSTSIGVQNNVLYEVVEPSTGVAPQQVLFKRIDDSLEIRLGGTPANAPANLILEGYFQLDNPPKFVGLAEDGQYYYFVPQSGLTEDLLESLEEDEVVFQSLGYDTVEEQTVWWPMILGGVALVGLGAAAIGGGSNGSSNNDEQPAVEDTKAPNVGFSDLATNDSTPALSGTVNDATASIVVTINGVDYPAINNGDGTWSLLDNTLPELAEGEYAVKITATDPSGNSSTVSGSLVIDLTAPDTPTINPSNGSDLSGNAEPGSLIQIDVNGDGKTDYTTVTDDSGSWSITFEPALENGSEVKVTATDKAGNESGPSVSTIDAQGPNIQVNDVLTNDTTPELGGTIDDPTATIIVSLNDEQYVATNNGDGTWILADNTLPSLADNSYIFTVTATDEVGNQGTATGVVVIDTNAPTVPAAPSTPELNPTNGSEVSGTAEAGSEVQVDVDGDGISDYTTVADGNGDWSITPDAPLADGTTVTATASDEAGNESAPATVVVDGVAPIVTVNDATTNDATPTLTGSVDDATASVTVTVDGADYPATNNGDGTWTLADNTLASLADNSYTVTVTATDEAGNQGTATGTLVIDTAAPAAPVLDATNGSEISGTAEAGSEVQVDVDGDGISDYTTVADGNGDWSITPDTPLADGTTVTATASDEAGNESAPATVVVDGVAPIVTVNDATTNDATPTLTGSVDDATASVTVTVDGADYPATNNGDGTWTLADNTLASLADNSYTVTVTATDEAGNQGTATGALVIDTAAPAAPVLDATNGSEISGTAEAGSEVQVDVDGDGISDYTTVADGNGDWSITPDTPLADGTTVTATASDEAGNESAPATVVVDGVAPIVTVNDATTNDATPTLTGSVDDATASVTVTVDGADYPATNNGDGTWTLADNTLASLADNSYTVTVTATDEAGNQGTATGALVIDTAAPAAPVLDATNGSEISGTAEAGSEVQVDVDGDGISDYTTVADGNGDWSITPDAPLADGTTVTATASDEAGNESAPATVVVDGVAPIVSVNDATTNDATPTLTGSVDDATASVTVTVDGADYPATNNGDGTWTLADNTLASLADNSYTVTVTATDEAGNQGVASGTLIVDTVGPIVTANDVTTNDMTPALVGTVNDVTANITVTVNGVDYPATNNGDGTWTLADNTLASLADNSYTVTVTATDEAGNQEGTATGTLVIDTAAPAAPVLDATNGSEISGTAEAGSEVQVDVDGDGISDYTTVADGNGDWSITPDTPLADGTTVTATASDEAGNESAPATVVVDGVAPIVTVNDATTNDATPTLTGSVDDATASVTVTVDGADYPATNNGDGTWTLADNTLASLADNSYIVTVTATDEAGNQGTATGTLVIDTAAPAAPVLDATNGSEISGTAEAGSEVQVDVDGDGISDYTTVADGNGDWSITPDAPLADGTTVTATASDEAGNESAPATVVVDGVAPIVSVNDATTNDATPTLTGSVDDATASVTVTVDGADYTATNNGDGTWTLADNTLASLADNSYTVTVTATDEAGNQWTTTGILNIDTVAPDSPVINAGNGTEISGIAEANSIVRLDVDSDGMPDYTTTADENGTWSITPDSPLNNGTEVVATATDKAGNTSAPATSTINTSAATVTFNNEVTNDDTPPLSGTISNPTANVVVSLNGTDYPATNNGDGTWTLADNTLASLADNSYTVTVTATDEAGNQGTATGTLVIDTTAPAAPVLDATNGSEISGTAEAGSEVQVDVDGDGISDYTTVADGNGDWSITPDTPLADGTTVTATASDEAGNESAPATVVVDGVAPIVTVNDATTNDATPTLTGSVDDATASVTVTVDGADYPATNNGDGTWTLADNTLASLADNSYTVTVTATDEAGNQGTATGTLVIDTAAPAAPVLDATNGSEISGTAEAGSEVQVDVDGDGISDYTTVADGNGDWSITPDTPLADGTTVTATASDEAGNESAPATVVVDGVAPIVTVNDATTNDATPTLTGSVDDATASVTVTVDGADYPATNNGDGTWTLADNTLASLADNSYIVTVTATDEAGNQGTATGTLVIDTAAPAAPVLDATNGSEISGTAEAGSEVQVDVDGDGISDYTTVADGNGDWSITPDAPLADGTTVTATASDEAGNESAPATVVVDGVAPIVSVNDATTNDATPTLTGSVDDATASVTVTVDGADYPATNNGDGTWTLADNTLASLADNSYTVTVTATDEAGNQGTATGTLVIDTTAPAAPVLDATNGSEISGTAEAGSEVQVDVDGDGISDYTTVADGNGDWSITPDTPLADGTTVTVTASDEAGNESAPATVVVDGVAPIVSVNDATINDATPTLTGSVDDATASVTVTVDGADYPATNNGDGTWTLADNTLASLTDNSYTVTVTATDEAGNQGTATGTLVIDTTAPAAPVLDATNGSEISGTAEAGSEVQVDVDGDGISDYTTVADGNGDWSITPDTPLADGTTVTATASDEAGNESAPATVVVDGVAPIVTVNDATTNDATPTLTGSVDDATASVTVTVDGADYPATNNGDGTWTLADNTLASLADNSYTVTVTATDEAGNQGTATGTLVIDTAAPAAPVLDATNGSEISGTAEAGSEVQVDVDGDGISDYTTVADGNGDWSITPDTPLADGTTVTATASDEAGNESAPATVVVDGVAPIVSVNDATTNDATPTLTGSVDDATASVTVTVDGADYPATNNGDGTWTLADNTLASLADNSYTVTVTATDEAGNQGVASGTLVIDTTGPSNGDGSNSIAFNDGGDELLSETESVSVSLSGQVEIGATIDSILVSDGNTNISIPTTNITVDGSGVVTVNNLNLSVLSDGLITVFMEVTDAVGNTGTVTDTTILDTSVSGGVIGEPIVSFDSITTDSGTGGDFITSDTTLVLTGTINTSEATLLTVNVSGTIYTEGTDPELTIDGSGNWVLDLSNATLSLGTHSVIATVTDEAGNSESSLAQDIVIQSIDAVEDTSSLDMGDPTVTVSPAQTTQDVQVVGVAESTGGTDASSAFTVSVDHVGEVAIEVSQKSLVAVADAYKVEVYNSNNELVYASVSANSQLADVGGLDVFNVTGDETVSFTVDGLAAGDYTVVVRNDESKLEELLDSDGNGDVNLTELGNAGVVLGPDNQDSVLNTVEGTLGVVLGPPVRGILESALDTTTEIGAGELVDVLTLGLDGLGLTGSLDIVLSAVADALLSNTLTVLQGTDITTTVTEYIYNGETEAQGNVITGNSNGEGADAVIAGSLITEVESSTGESLTVNASGVTTIEGQFGTLDIESDGSYRYVANGDRASVGQNEIFTYTLSDGETSDTATLTIAISGTDFTAASAQSDSVDMALGVQTSQVSEPVTDSDTQVLGLLEGASSDTTLSSISTTNNASSISSTPIIVGSGFNGEVVVEVNQEALVAVADAYVVEVVDAQGQVVRQAMSPDNPLVGDVAGLTVLGVTGDDTLVANFSGLPAGEYSVVVRNDESELANLFDTSGDNNVSLTELGSGGVVLGTENQEVLLDAIESALNGNVLGSAGGLGVGSAVRTFILEPLLASADSIGAGDLVDTLTTGLNAIGLASVVDEVLDIVADTLLSNTLTLLQRTDVTSTLTEYQFEGSTTVSGNVIQGGNAGEVADSLTNGGVVTQVTNSDGDIVTVLGSSTSGVVLSGQYGELTVYEDGNYTYVANGARAGLGDSDSFTYTISDGFSNSSAELTFNLSGQGAASDTAIAGLHYDYVSVVEPEITDALNVSWLVSLGGSQSDTYSVEVAANTTQDLRFTLDSNELLGLGSNVTLTLAQDVGGVMTEVESFSDDALLSLVSGNSGQVIFDGLAEGSYEVTLTVNVPVGVAGSLGANLTSITHYMDQYTVDEVSVAEGNLFDNDVQFGTDYSLSVSGDGLNFETVATNTTLVGQYGALNVDAQGNYSYTPDSNLAVFGGILNDSFTYEVVYPDGTVERTQLNVFVKATGEGVPESVTTMMEAMLSYTAEESSDLTLMESSDGQVESLASSDSGSIVIDGVMFSNAGSITPPLTSEEESNVGY
ncbi:Ig-like domain-containing protein [Vibrio alginolyticus]|uniref:Ig-like domain-containing protein n=2 Tax=Vibrio alginolyticus TaxID=663 RepID=UPI0012AE17ED|nr:Ig-like domain-containing protein [Vibrio alginolyticus]